MFCSTCGSSISPGAAFCSTCGCACSSGGAASATGAGTGMFVENVSRQPFTICSSWRAFKSFWTFQDWNRRATRTEYWSFFLWKFLLQLGFYFASALVVGGVLIALAVSAELSSPSSPFLSDAAKFASASSGGGFIALVLASHALVSLAFLVPTLCATIRRLHDVDASGAFALLLFVPQVATIATVVIGFLDPTPGDARFGSNPRFVSRPISSRPETPTSAAETQNEASAERSNETPSE